MIKLNNIAIKYADRVVLDIPHLVFEEGKHYGLIGENNSRKTNLLDEPTSSTDIKGTNHIENTLLRYVAETGCTMIFSMHSPTQALRQAEEVIILDQDRIVEQGPAEQVLKDPQNESARLFLQHW